MQDRFAQICPLHNVVVFNIHENELGCVRMEASVISKLSLF